jgi:hypothetical protein
VLDAIVRAAHWICDMQDLDGAWRRYFYKGLACALAHMRRAGSRAWRVRRRTTFSGRGSGTSLGACSPRPCHRLVRPADFLKRIRRPAGHTHTIAPLWGVLLLSERLTVREGVDAVRAAAESLMHRLERSKMMPGILNHEWRAQSSFVCLTGNAQLAILWLKLAETGGDLRYVSAAFKAIDQVKRAQSLTSAAPGIRGGVPGSWPIGGEYISYALPNWAAKFFADALLAKRAHLAGAPVALSGV